MPWLSCMWFVFSLEVVHSITLLPASNRQCRMGNGEFAFSPKHFIFGIPSSSYFFPALVQVASISDSPLGKNLLQCGSFMGCGSFRKYPSSVDIHILCPGAAPPHLLGLGTSSVVSPFFFQFFSTQSVFYSIFFPSEKCHRHGRWSQLCVAVSPFWSWQEPPVSATREAQSPSTNATLLSSTLMPTPLKTAIDCIKTPATVILQW